MLEPLVFHQMKWMASLEVGRVAEEVRGHGCSSLRDLGVGQWGCVPPLVEKAQKLCQGWAEAKSKKASL